MISPRATSRPAESIASGVRVYLVGFVLAVILTAMSFYVASSDLLWGPGIAMGLVVLAIAQMGVHLAFFLLITLYQRGDVKTAGDVTFRQYQGR